MISIFYVYSHHPMSAPWTTVTMLQGPPTTVVMVMPQRRSRTWGLTEVIAQWTQTMMIDS